MTKSARSHRLGRGPIGKEEVESSVGTAIKPCEVIATTPVECVKYNISLDKAKIMEPKDLILADYLYLRRTGKLSKQKIKNLYAFRDDGIFYKTLKEIGAFPEPEQLDNEDDLREAAAEVFNVISPGATLSQHIKPSIITKHICPICMEEYDSLAQAEICLQAHTWIIGIERTDGSCEADNCPMFIYAKLSDGRVAKYMAMNVQS